LICKTTTFIQALISQSKDYECLCSENHAMTPWTATVVKAIADKGVK